MERHDWRNRLINFWSLKVAIKNTELFKGIQVNDAIVRIEMLTLLSAKNSMEVVLQFRADEYSPPFKGESFSAPYELEGENPFAQAYAHLKTLQEFAGATDC